LLGEYAGICGITKAEMKKTLAPEIKAMAAALALTEEDCLQALQAHYDGYHFAPRAEGIYNPFSLLNALADKRFKAYWFATGTPTFLVRRVRQVGLDANRFTNRTLYADEYSLTDYRYENPDNLPLPYRPGYLTIIDYDDAADLYILGFPNREVKYSFLKSLLPEYAPIAVPSSGKDIYALRLCVNTGDTEGMGDILTALFASIPYTTGDAPFEHYFQSVLYIVFTLLGQFVQCEVHSSRGRADCIAETEQFVYIFEFKVDKPAQEALQQIEDKGYAAPFAADSRQVFKIGVSFDSEKRSLAEWLVNI
jgi:hypothetical protein